MAGWYQTTFVDTGRSGALWLLIGFIATYAITRRITVRIRATAAASDGDQGDGAVKDVYIGGVHIHHQVWGILLVLAMGLVELRFRPDSPWQEIIAALFGAGAALALDEFALWLHVDDVYWSEEGRKSIDAVMIAAVIGLVLLTGTSPIGISDDTQQQGLIGVTVYLIVHIFWTIVCLLKGKIPTGLIGFVLPIISFVGALRLAKPGSYWARRFYDEAKLTRATARFGEEHQQRVEKLRDLVSGGNPDA